MNYWKVYYVDISNQMEYIAIQLNICLKNLSLTHWGRDKMAAILQTTFSNAISWMEMFEFRLKSHSSMFLRVQLIIFHHWFR